MLGVAIAIGIFIGYFLPGNNGGRNGFPRLKTAKHDKIQNVLDYIVNEYVDTLNTKDLEDDAIVSLLQQLDPHSAYIPAAELETASEQLEGNFDGIGIEFNIQRDTIMVVAAITGGPSESLGIQSGDRIVKIEKNNVAGKKIKNEDVIKQLRGKNGTKVKVSIFRPGKKALIDYTITRGKIPIFSIDASLMITPEIGYIKISRFAATTYDEYLDAFKSLQKEGMKQLVVDLRDNPGGYLNAAVDISDEFLAKGKSIVYTKGKSRKPEEFNASSKGGFEEGGLVILIDEGSASASEIVSGAVQDNDRGWVVGRRSFGKGLVQEEIRFDDGSAMRLTIARYYTPSGRCIQKSYEKGLEDYYKELSSRMQHGELENADSVKFGDTLAFKTTAGRTVYGGGGIMPDVFVALDTSRYSNWLSQLASKGLMSRFAFEYTDQRKKELLSLYKSPEDFSRSFSDASAFPEFLAFAEKNGAKADPAGLKASENLVKEQVNALIGRALYGNKGYYSIVNNTDPAIKKAVELLKSNKLVSASQSRSHVGKL